MEQKLCGEGKASPSSQHIQGTDPLGEIRVVMTTRTRIRFWFFGVFFELKPLLATKVICKQFITSIVLTCILHGSMSVVDNQKAYHS